MSSLSDLLYLPMPTLQTSSNRNESIGVSLDASSAFAEREEWTPGGKWEDDEERRFHEDLSDLKDYVPRSVLGIESEEEQSGRSGQEDRELQKREIEELEAEVAKLASTTHPERRSKVDAREEGDDADNEDDDATPVPTPPRTPSPQPSTGPGQQLTALLAKLPEATNRDANDDAAVEFALLNSKASRKRLVKVSATLLRHAKICTERSVS